MVELNQLSGQKKITQEYHDSVVRKLKGDKR